MKNGMTWDKNGLLIPNGELAEQGLDCAELSAQMSQSLIMLMPQEMTAAQAANVLAGLLDAASQITEAVLDACKMPCGKHCDRAAEEFDLDAVPEMIRILLLNSGCCPSGLAYHLEEGDIIYAVK